MPSINKKNTFKIILECDIGKVPQPAFIYRSLTLCQLKTLMGMEQRLREDDPEGQMDLLMEACGTGLVGWEHMTDPDTGKKIAFDRGLLGDLITISEANELVVKMTKQTPKF